LAVSKLADVIVIGVHYSNPGWNRRIEAVRLSPELSAVSLMRTQLSRDEMVQLVKRYPQSCYTAYQERGVWKRGARIEIVTINLVAFLRTDANPKAEDNLGNLPEF